MAYKPIRDYGMIGDCRTAALVGLDGSIDWMCWPRFDSPSLFAAILDDKHGGRFSIKPTSPYRSTQEYIRDTNVLVTVFETDGGHAELIDFLAAGDRRQLCRIITGVSGEIELEVEFAPRFNYGRELPTFEGRESVIAASASGAVELRTQIPLNILGNAACSVWTARAGDKKAFALGETGADSLSLSAAEAELREAIAFWRDWLKSCPYEGPWRLAVTRSALAVKALTYKETGLMIAAPTTSLPEKIGGDKNWDYRYVWLRDASMVLGAMFHLGHMTDEGARFLKFLVDKGGADPARLAIMYAVGGDKLNGEQVVSGLEGYMGSAPVRIGNEAANQFQLDVYGEALLCAHRYTELVGTLEPDVWGAIITLAEFIIDNWTRPDMGIWEERGEPRHYTHSKMMCAVGLQSALATQQRTGLPAPTKRWEQALSTIKRTIIERAYNPDLGSFTKAFESTELDAGALLMSVYDFLPATDERLRSTADRLIHTLGYKGLIYRFKWSDEALGVSEGAFAIASIWLAIHFIKLGKLDFAAEYIQAIVDSANHVGLLAEEIEASTGHFLGNFPQLFVHTALINAVNSFNTATQARVPANRQA